MSNTNTCKVRWELVTPGGPARVNHVGVVIGCTLYIHGGLTKKGAREPSNALFVLDGDTGIWREIRTPGSPALSHHAAIAMYDRYVVLIGGWTGKCRTSLAHVYDTQLDCWRAGRTRGFPDNSGLSSHTATLLTNGEILVVGREGSLRLSTHMGTAYVLHADVERGLFSYVTFRMPIDSRSGHTTNGIGSTVVVLGGREDKLVNVHRIHQRVVVEIPDSLRALKRLAEASETGSCFPASRKQHIAMSGPSLVMMHGGETFDGRSRWPVGDIHVLLTKPDLRWVLVAGKSINRAGHICVVFGGKVIIHGGEGPNNCVHTDTYSLVVTDVPEA